MLLGEYEHTIDDKNRLTLPARFREALGGGVVVTRGLDTCLQVYTPVEWQLVVDRQLGQLDPLSREAREMERYFYSAAVEADVDKQGRGMIPAPLMSYAKLARDVVVAGGPNRPDSWAHEARRQKPGPFPRGAE